MGLKTYKGLIVWQRAMEVVVEIYKIARLLPKDEQYGLSSQMKRAGVSMPSNIAEGFYRAHKPEQKQFFKIAYASGAELETQIEILKRLGFISGQQTALIDKLLSETMRMLNKFSDY